MSTPKTHTPTLARAHGSPVDHLLVVGTKTTRCGKDATAMARYSPADNRVDSKPRPVCVHCQEARPTCTCGALDFGGCFCNISVADFLATPVRGPFARRA